MTPVIVRQCGKLGRVAVRHLVPVADVFYQNLIRRLRNGSAFTHVILGLRKPILAQDVSSLRMNLPE
jgi:hypothetical protein